MKRTRIVFYLILSSAILPLTVPAQEFRTAITGLVSDPSGAPIPGAKVDLRHSGTNEVRSITTDGSGRYTVPFLPPGTYVLTAEAAGFKKFVREGLTLQVGQSATIDVTLEVGPVSEALTVTARAPLLDDAKADRGGTIDRLEVHELPINARNPYMLSNLVTGVKWNGQAIYPRPFDNGAIAQWSMNGSRNYENEFLLDGAPNDAEAGTNNIAYVPPVDSVQEFKIQTNSYDAQYGHTGGGIVNVSLKSGTNAFHGAGYEFARRNGWDANSFQNNAAGKPKGDHILDQYGVELEGPVYIPEVYNGKNKTFFLFNIEKYRERDPNPEVLSVPALDMRSGDFSKLVNSAGQLITIYDPATGKNLNGTWTRTPFPGNIIPGDRINPIAENILGFMPKPNTTTPGQAYSQLNYVVPPADSLESDHFHNIVAKIDQNFGESNRIFFRHASNRRCVEEPYNGIRLAPGENGNLPHCRINEADVIDWVGILNARTIFNLRFSYGRFTAQQTNPDDRVSLTSLGFPQSLAAQVPQNPWFGLYTFSSTWSAGNPLGYDTLGGQLLRDVTNTFALAPSFTKILGPHSLKAGGDLRRVQYNLQNPGNPFTLTFGKDFTQAQYNIASPLNGDAIADALLGEPTSGAVNNIAFTVNTYAYYAPWIQDDWRISRKLSINLGLRWDFFVPPYERYNRLNRGFDASVTNSVTGLVNESAFPGTSTLLGSLLFAGVNGQPDQAAQTYYKALQPRVGGAYQITSNLVVRGGWGRYYINPTNDFLQTNGFSATTPLVSSLDNLQTPIPSLLSNPFPNGILQPPGSTLGDRTFLGQGFNFVNTNMRPPHVDQFSVGFQYILPLQSKLEVTYAGNRTNDELDGRLFNEPSLAVRRQCDPLEGGNPNYCNQLLPNPFQGLAPFTGTSFYTAPTISRFQLSRPFPEFGSLNQVDRNDGKIWYNSMQVSYQIRAREGLNLLLSYTLSKMIVQTGFLDAQQNIMQRSLYDWDTPNRFTVASVYQLPFGKGKRWLNGSHGFVNRLISGWENTWMITYQSGRPWNLPSNVLYVQDARVQNINWSAPIVYGVKPCVAQMNNDGSVTMEAYSAKYGCTSYNFLVLPQYAPQYSPTNDGRLRLNSAPTADLSLNWTTRVTEKTNLQFRAEAFNVFNTFVFYQQQFNNNPNDPLFGSITKSGISFSNSNFPRYVQLAVKFIW